MDKYRADPTLSITENIAQALKPLGFVRHPLYIRRGGVVATAIHSYARQHPWGGILLAPPHPFGSQYQAKLTHRVMFSKDGYLDLDLVEAKAQEVARMMKEAK